MVSEQKIGQMPKRNEIPSMNRRGSVTIFTTLWLLVVFAVASLSVDGGYWYLTRIREQKAADGAAIAGAIALAYNQAGSTAVTVAARAIAAENGFTNSTTTPVNSKSTLVTVYSPPTSGPYANNDSAVQVTLSKPAQTFFSVAFGLISAPPTIAASAVALLNNTSVPVCMLSLSGPFRITGHASVNSQNCGLGSNNTGTRAFDIAGKARIDVYEISTAGGIYFPGNDDVNQNVQLETHQLPISNPFSALNSMNFTAPDAQAPTSNRTSKIYYPGTYTDKLNASGNTNLIFEPGLYILQDGIKISGDANTNGVGVTFVVTGGTFDVSGSASMNFTAPVTDVTYPALDGVLFYVSPDASQNVTITGNARTNFSGGMYFPEATVAATGSSSSQVGSAACHVLIAATINIKGNSSFYNDSTQSGCSAAGTPLIHPQFVELVE